ncbi:glycine zipper 2TM domain-containing protein [Alteraurantiacibacter aquimixticola]|uniref:17 kDa surface antigen n=1 Tax=Alteraurantiacibacter aquimixticola TaxID=2489173 RepID=A0A4T3F2Q1_9SPHN|nr:glycine zipper 2TM domain-containing protein [Alteraurantiacibacter aquimixticola]TIX50370.1 glycine zipper 2TM domain-containing protein [Alteraurantiacibacter aquimixticola]
MRKTLTLTAAAAAAMLAIPAAPAAADPPGWAPAHGYYDHDRGYDRYDRHDRYEARYDRRDHRRDHRREHRRDRVYDDYGRYEEPRRVRRGDRVWRGDDGRYYCERDNGTTGLIIGAAGGALLGRTIDTRGDRTVGTLLGAALGGLLGREIDRGEARCR